MPARKAGFRRFGSGCFDGAADVEAASLYAHVVSKDDLVRKMREYRAGTKPGTIMPQLAKGYTDAQIELIGGWFATQKVAK